MFSDCRHLIDVTQQLQTLCWKRAVKSHCTKNQDSSETVNSVNCCPQLHLCYSMSYQPSIFQVFHWKSSQLCWPLWPVLCPSFALWWCYCEVHTSVPHESCSLWCTLRKEKVEKGWVLFLCADSQVGSQTSILLTFKAALKAMRDQAITLTNSAFST